MSTNGDALASADDETGLIHINKVYLRDKNLNTEPFFEGQQLVVSDWVSQLGYFVCQNNEQLETIPVIGQSNEYLLAESLSLDFDLLRNGPDSVN